MNESEQTALTDLSQLDLNPPARKAITELEDISRRFNDVKWENVDQEYTIEQQQEQRMLRIRRWKVWQELYDAMSPDPVVKLAITDVLASIKQQINQSNVNNQFSILQDIGTSIIPSWTAIMEQLYANEYVYWKGLTENEKQWLLAIAILGQNGDISKFIAPEHYSPQLLIELDRWKYLPPRQIDEWSRIPLKTRQNLMASSQNAFQWFKNLIPPEQQKYKNLIDGLFRWNLLPPTFKNEILAPGKINLESMAKLASLPPLQPDTWAAVYRSTNMMLNPPVRCQSCLFAFTNLASFERMFEEEIRREAYLTSIQKRMFTYKFQGLKQKYVLNVEHKGESGSGIFIRKQDYPDLSPQELQEMSNVSMQEHMETALPYAEAKPWLRAAVRYGIKRTCCLNTLMTGFSVLPVTATLDNSRLLRIASKTSNARSLPRMDEQSAAQQQRLFMRRTGQRMTDTLNTTPGQGYVGIGSPKIPAIMSNQFMSQPGVRRPPEANFYTYAQRTVWVNDENKTVQTTSREEYPITTRSTYNDQISIPSRAPSNARLSRAIVQIQVNGQNIEDPRTFYYSPLDRTLLMQPEIKRYINQILEQQPGGANQYQLNHHNIDNQVKNLNNEFHKRRFPIDREERVTLNFTLLS